MNSKGIIFLIFCLFIASLGSHLKPCILCQGHQHHFISHVFNMDLGSISHLLKCYLLQQHKHSEQEYFDLVANFVSNDVNSILQIHYENFLKEKLALDIFRILLTTYRDYRNPQLKGISQYTEKIEVAILDILSISARHAFWQIFNQEFKSIIISRMKRLEEESEELKTDTPWINACFKADQPSFTQIHR